MKTPKLKVRNRDGVYTIECQENHKRKFKSLGTKDEMEAVILFKTVETNILRELLGISKKAHTISRNGLISQFLNHNTNWSDDIVRSLYILIINKNPSESALDYLRVRIHPASIDAECPNTIHNYILTEKFIFIIKFRHG